MPTSGTKAGLVTGTYITPLYISEKTLTKQAKLLQRTLPVKQLKYCYCHCRNILAKFYGYRDDHAYRRAVKNTSSVLNPERIKNQLSDLVNRLSAIAAIEGRLAK